MQAQIQTHIKHTVAKTVCKHFLRTVLLCIFLFVFQNVCKADDDSTGVKNIGGKTYILHKVESGQGLYGIARIYHSTVPDIQHANKMTGTTILPGQVIMVPYTGNKGVAAKASLAKPKPADKKGDVLKPKPAHGPGDETVANDGREPIMHTITKKETLHQIAVNHKLTEQQLRDWNHSDLKVLTPGAKMIVGYKAKKTKIVANTPDIKKAAPIKTEAKKNEKTADTKNAKKKEPLVAQEPAAPRVPGNASKRIVTENGMGTWVDDGSIKTEVSLAMHKTAPAGTIIKLTNPMNNMVKYVKVVGALPDIEENKNILIKISKNTADELGIRDKDFRVNLEYAVEDTSSN